MIARPAAILLLALLAACARDRPAPAQPETFGPAPTEPLAPIVTTAPAGRYTIDRAHANLVFRIDHLGFSD